MSFSRAAMFEALFGSIILFVRRASKGAYEIGTHGDQELGALFRSSEHEQVVSFTGTDAFEFLPYIELQALKGEIFGLHVVLLNNLAGELHRLLRNHHLTIQPPSSLLKTGRKL
jgi:hypothetical protein